MKSSKYSCSSVLHEPLSIIYVEEIFHGEKAVSNKNHTWGSDIVGHSRKCIDLSFSTFSMGGVWELEKRERERERSHFNGVVVVRLRWKIQGKPVENSSGPIQCISMINRYSRIRAANILHLSSVPADVQTD